MIQYNISDLRFQPYALDKLLQWGHLLTPEKGKDILPNSRIMVHQPSAGFQGQATDIQILQKKFFLKREIKQNLLKTHW